MSAHSTQCAHCIHNALSPGCVFKGRWMTPEGSWALSSQASCPLGVTWGASDAGGRNDMSLSPSTGLPAATPNHLQSSTICGWQLSEGSCMHYSAATIIDSLLALRKKLLQRLCDVPDASKTEHPDAFSWLLLCRLCDWQKSIRRRWKVRLNTAATAAIIDFAHAPRSYY